ncbi:MAG TPA: VOC family protein [Candidatus Binatia bacterium]|jgi:catechol 2,3-dioxygenase-like lactoylglutathione lyase family enzyme|nr:VOC family protein [Candidatus Binatia bacterium]
MEPNGIAHIQLTVSDLERSITFYEPLLHFFGMKTIVKTPETFYCVGSRTGVAISRADPQYRDDRFQQRRIGLHHFCFRARSREDVDKIFQFVEGLGARIVQGPQEDHFAPGYYSILFEDPDGIRIEVNHAPGKGLLDPQAKLPLGETLSETS